MSRPLDGLVAVAPEQAIAAPLATRRLADPGARVITIERVDEGDSARHISTTSTTSTTPTTPTRG